MFTFICEKIIRASLKKKLEDEFLHNRKIIDEFGVMHGLARIDVAVVTDSFLYGYEIKSDYDTLFRLPNQVRGYNAVFDQISLVVGKNHMIDAIDLVPDWWGISVASFNSDNAVTVHTVRRPESNPKQSAVSVARLLWKNEALDVLKKRKEDVGFRSKSRNIIYNKLASVLSIDEIKREVSGYLEYSEHRQQSALRLGLCGG